MAKPVRAENDSTWYSGPFGRAVYATASAAVAALQDRANTSLVYEQELEHGSNVERAFLQVYPTEEQRQEKESARQALAALEHAEFAALVAALSDLWAECDNEDDDDPITEDMTVTVEIPGVLVAEARALLARIRDAAQEAIRG